jgi:hypothetical protein
MVVAFFIFPAPGLLLWLWLTDNNNDWKAGQSGREASCNTVATWFETRGVATLLTMRVLDLILRSGVFAASRRMKPPTMRQA